MPKIRVEVNDALAYGGRGVTFWWSNHEWSDLTFDDAVAVWNQLGAALFEVDQVAMIEDFARRVGHSGS